MNNKPIQEINHIESKTRWFPQGRGLDILIYQTSKPGGKINLSENQLYLIYYGIPVAF